MSAPDLTPARSKRRRILLTITLVIFVIGVSALGLFLQAIRNATIPLGKPPGQITFVSNRDGQWDVFRLDPDGTLTNLMAGGDGPTANDYFGSWAIDSQRMNVLSDRTGEMGPTQVEPDGANPRSLDVVSAIITLFGEGRLDWDPAWSPNGDKMLWSSLRDLNLELYWIDTASDFSADNAVRLTNNGGRDWFAAWSPDGQQIAFSSDREGNENIYTLGLSEGEPIQLTQNDWDELHPVWSLDGQQIVYVNDENDALLDGIVQLAIMNADGTDARAFGNTIFEGDPTYSPDGKQVLFMSNKEGDWNIYLMDMNGDNVRRLTDSDADDLFPVWRP